MSFEIIGIDQVLQAIDALYNNSNLLEKDSASKWLVKFQKSISAWKLSDELLYKARDLHSTYFGAQTLRNKIQLQFSELPVDSHLHLKDSLLKHVQSINESTPNPISNQIFLAIADLYLLMVVWKDGLKEIINVLLSAQHGLHSLLCILKFIPEELKNRTLRLGSNRKNDILGDLELNRKAMLEILSLNLSATNENGVSRIFECLASWWDNTNVMRPSDIKDSNLIDACFCVLKNPLESSEVLYESVTQWLTALIYQCKDNRNTSCTDELLSHLQINIYSLVNIVQQSESQHTQMNQEQISIVQERLTCLAHIFSALSRALKHYFIFSPSHNDGKLGDLRTMECLISILELSYPLGKRALVNHLLDAIHSIIYSASQHRYSNDRDSTNALKALMPYLSRIVIGFIRHCSSTSISRESSDELREFRDDIYNIMQDLTPLIGAETIFTELNSFIARSQLLAPPNQRNQAQVMEDCEASLFMMSTVARHLSPHDPDGYISNLMQSLVIPGMALNPSFRVQEVACFLCMELFDWAAIHPSLRREMIEQLVKIIETGATISSPNELKINQKEAIQTAFTALGKILETNRPPTRSSIMDYGSSVIDDHWDTVINRVIYKIPRLPWAPVHEVVQFHENVGAGLMNSLGFYTAESDPTQSRATFPVRITQLFSVSLECLTRLIEGNVTSEGDNTLSDPAVWLHYISSGWRSFAPFVRRLWGKTGRFAKYNEQGVVEFDSFVNVPIDEKIVMEAGKYALDHTVLYVQNTVWPIISRAMSFYQTKDRTMEHAARCIRFMVRSLSTNLRAILPSIAEKIVEVNTLSPHSCFLYLTSILVDEFGQLPDCRDGLFNVFDALLIPTLRNLDGNGLFQNPNVSEDLFRLTLRLTEKCPDQFLARQQTDSCLLLDLATRCLELPSFVNRDTSELNEIEDKKIEDVVETDYSESRALYQSVEFILQVLHFTSKSAFDTPMSIFQTTNLSDLPNLTNSTELGARKVLIWLVRTSRFNSQGDEIQAPEGLSGGHRLIRACLLSLFHPITMNSITDMGGIIFSLKNITNHDMFISWFQNSISAMHLKRADGHEFATETQVQEFFSMIMSASRVKDTEKALEWFSRLFV